jgi:hypothetical protein
MRIDQDDPRATPPFPEIFTYDKITKILTVEYTNGVIVNYFDVNPKAIFLNTMNPRRIADFLAVRNQYRNETIKNGL